MLATLEQTAYRLFATQFKTRGSNCVKLHFKAGSTIVANGILKPSKKINFYSAVPLSYIESGSVSIIEHGKAVKHFNQGESLGLFETAHFLETGMNKRIGRWSVKAISDVDLLVSSDEFLEQTPAAVKGALVKAARYNPIPKPLTKLPLLDWFAKAFDVTPQKDTVIIYHSHIFDSTVDLIKHLAYLAGSDNTFVLEKPYSTIPHAFAEITSGGVRTYQLKVDANMSYEYSVKRNVDYVWREIVEHVRLNKIKNIIVVSDGADVLLSPVINELKGVKIVGVEQTERGFRRLSTANLSFPVISIAEAKAKKELEAPFIANASLDKMAALGLFQKKPRYGIIGAGSIGQEIIRGLKKYGINPLIYQRGEFDSALGKNAHSLEKLVQESDIIIGNTGTDCLRGMHLERLQGKKIFISTSSSNVEFAYLFDLAKTYANRFEDVSLQISKSFQATILNGGYPINFDRNYEWEGQNNIQLTRALIYAGVYEALLNKNGGAKLQSLQSELETSVVNKWLELRA